MRLSSSRLSTIPLSLPITPRPLARAARCWAWQMATASASAASGVAALLDGQQHPHHHRDLRLFGVTDADHRLLDQIGRIFRDRQAGQGEGRQRRAARLAEFQRRLRIAVDKGLLDRGFGRPPRGRRSRRARDGWRRAVRRAQVAASVWIEPQATKASRAPATSIIPQPVLRRPGSTPRTRIGAHVHGMFLCHRRTRGQRRRVERTRGRGMTGRGGRGSSRRSRRSRSEAWRSPRRSCVENGRSLCAPAPGFARTIRVASML